MSNATHDHEPPERVRQRLREAIQVRAFHPPAEPAEVAAAEARLGVPFPPWLRALYLACDGFVGPDKRHGYLAPLSGPGGLVEYTECLRHSAEGMPPSIARAIVFGHEGVSFTVSIHFAALEGVLTTWGFGDADFTPFGGTVYDLYRQLQAELRSFAAEDDPQRAK